MSDTLSIFANAYGGHDHEDRGGVMRTAVEDTDRLVYVFSPSLVLQWQVRLSDTTPEAVYKAVTAAALEAIRRPAR